MRVRPIRAWADSSRSFIPVPSVAAEPLVTLRVHSAITSNWHVQIVSRSGPLMLRTLEFPIPFGEGGWLLRDPFLRSEEHTSELQSRGHLVCRLLLEKKKR